MSLNVLGDAWSGAPRPRRIPGIAVAGLVLGAVALGGLGLATYLAFENVQGQSGVCTGLAHGCATVQQSKYGKIAGVPVSVPGAALYAVLAALAAAWAVDLRGWRPTWALLGGLGAFGGFAFSMYLTGIEAFVLETWCVYCIVSAALMTALAALWLVPVFIEARRVT